MANISKAVVNLAVHGEETTDYVKAMRMVMKATGVAAKWAWLESKVPPEEMQRLCGAQWDEECQ